MSHKGHATEIPGVFPAQNKNINIDFRKPNLVKSQQNLEEKTFCNFVAPRNETANDSRGKF